MQEVFLPRNDINRVLIMLSRVKASCGNAGIFSDPSVRNCVSLYLKFLGDYDKNRIILFVKGQPAGG
jgi:hypothetical protein